MIGGLGFKTLLDENFLQFFRWFGEDPYKNFKPLLKFFMATSLTEATINHYWSTIIYYEYFQSLIPNLLIHKNLKSKVITR